MIKKLFFISLVSACVIGGIVYWVWLKTGNKDKALVVVLVGWVLWIFLVIYSIAKHAFGNGKLEKMNEDWQKALNAAADEDEKIEEEIARKRREAEEHRGSFYTIWEKRLPSGKVKLSWEFKTMAGFGEMLFQHSGMELLGFRSEGTGFDVDSFSESGKCIVSSRGHDGSWTDEDVKAGHEYFYTFFLRGQTEEGNWDKSDSVRFPVKIATHDPSVTKSQESLEVRADAIGKARARAAMARAKQKLILREEEEKEVAQLRASKLWQEADENQRYILEDEIRKEFETERDVDK